MKYLIPLLTLATLTSAAAGPQRAPASSATVILDPATLDKDFGEYIVPGEEKSAQKLMSLFSKHMKNKYEDLGKEARRAVHAKDHGCLKDVKFEVLDHGDNDLKFSVFRDPRTYDAFVRLSNGDGPPGRDTDKNVSIGFAIKLLNVPNDKLLPLTHERAQDFLMINQPAFLVKDIVDFSALIEAREHGVIDKGLFAITHRDSIKFRHSASPKDDPLNTSFWSALPFRLGNTAIKYMICPCDPKAKTTGSSADFLTDLVRDHIEREDACFDFFLQKRGDNAQMLIEDASAIWSEVVSNPIRVAQIRIPKQTMRDDTKQKTCEQAEFSPWITTADFRPLSNLNRIRRTVYELSSSERHRINHTADPFADR